MMCRWIDARLEGLGLIDAATGERPAAGSMFWAPWELEDAGVDGRRLGRKYLDLPHPRRLPIGVICPNGEYFCLDQRAYDHSRGGYFDEGWTITGWAPLLNVTPSIDLKGRWHGFLTAGVFRTA